MVSDEPIADLMVRHAPEFGRSDPLKRTSAYDDNRND
jgi:hypothetical protein